MSQGWFSIICRKVQFYGVCKIYGSWKNQYFCSLITANASEITVLSECRQLYAQPAERLRTKLARHVFGTKVIKNMIGNSVRPALTTANGWKPFILIDALTSADRCDQDSSIAFVIFTYYSLFDSSVSHFLLNEKKLFLDAPTWVPRPDLKTKHLNLDVWVFPDQKKTQNWKIGRIKHQIGKHSCRERGILWRKLVWNFDKMRIKQHQMLEIWNKNSKCWTWSC